MTDSLVNHVIVKCARVSAMTSCEEIERKDQQEPDYSEAAV